MSDAPDTSTAAPSPLAPSRPIPRARPYLRLLLIVPALACLGVGLYFQYNVPEGGEVSAIKLTTKTGMVGQAAEAVANIDPSTPDLFLKVFTPKGEQQLPQFKDTPIGNGLTWNLSQTYALPDIQRVEVWDHHHWPRSDKQLDRITMNAWSVDGQRFHVDLLGKRNEPPKWALPVAAVGGALSLLVLLRFVWDQVI